MPLKSKAGDGEDKISPVKNKAPRFNENPLEREEAKVGYLTRTNSLSKKDRKPLNTSR